MARLMPALNFSEKFAPLVESGEKRQTIRKLRKDGRDPKPGDTLYLYTGMRTKKCRKIGEAECLLVEPVQINSRIAVINGCVLIYDPSCSYDSLDMDSLAKADGFVNWKELADWFEKIHGLAFHGLLIRWEAPQD